MSAHKTAQAKNTEPFKKPFDEDPANPKITAHVQIWGTGKLKSFSNEPPELTFETEPFDKLIIAPNLDMSRLKFVFTGCGEMLHQDDDFHPQRTRWLKMISEFS